MHLIIRYSLTVAKKLVEVLVAVASMVELHLLSALVKVDHITALHRNTRRKQHTRTNKATLCVCV